MNDIRRRDLLQAAALASTLSMSAQASAEADTGSLQAFALSAVRLLDGPFLQAQRLDGAYLLSLDPKRLLHNFMRNAGLKPQAPVYGGWESQEPWISIRCHGHTLGHYLSACAMMWAATGEAAYRERVTRIVQALHDCQQASGSGMVCAFPDGETQLRNSFSGQPIIGVPWYTQHKVLAGLRDAHLFAQDALALPVLRRLADWIDEAARGCDEAQFQQMLDVEHGGMNEVLADLYVLSREPRYLALAQRFNHRALLDPLADGRDSLDGWHSNTQIPKVIGFERLGQLTGQAHLKRAARYFWGTVVERRSFATGGHGDIEHFYPGAEVREHLQSAKTMETCSTHNMLRLTRALFLEQTAPVDTAYADYYERALINGILASQDPATGMFTYFQATRPGYPKLYCTPEHSFWCCTGTGMENHAKYGDSIYFHAGKTLYVNLFIASELDWAEQGVRIRQLTCFPEQASTRLLLRTEQPRELSLRLRHPAWCEQASVRVNGKLAQRSQTPGGYIELKRTWRDGDVLQLDLPMHLYLEPLADAPEVAAVMLGPLTLAARMGREGMGPGEQLIVNERSYGEPLKLAAPLPLPELAAASQPLADVLKPVPGRPLHFQVASTRAGRSPMELAPYYRLAHERYSLYWRLS